MLGWDVLSNHNSKIQSQPKRLRHKFLGRAREKLSWYGFVSVELRVIMPRVFEGGLKYEEWCMKSQRTLAEQANDG